MKIIRLLIEFIIGLLTRKEPKPELAIPYPEEKPDFTVTAFDVKALVKRFCDRYQVHDPEWVDTIDVVCDAGLSVPACSYSESKRIHISPAWANPGTLAHEMAHVSYAQLTEPGKEWFNLVLIECDDPLLKLLDEQNSYMNTSVIEAHAEIYRYLGPEMPDELKQYYPHLLDRRIK